MGIELAKPTLEELVTWNWAKLEPHYKALVTGELTAASVADWLLDWTQVSELTDELYNRLYVATTVNTVDKQAEDRYKNFMDNIYPKAMESEQQLKEKLLASGLEPDGFAIPLRNMRAEADLFRKQNLPLLVEEEKLSNALDKIIGAQTVEWEGEERTIRQMEVVLRNPDRERRRKGWELMSERRLQDRDAINSNWRKYFELRQKIAKNAGKQDYRAYKWQQLKRFDYTPQDCLAFHEAIEQVAVPAMNRLAKRRQEKRGIDTLRYYDLFVDCTNYPPLQPFKETRELTDKASAIFNKVHPCFGEYFRLMDHEGLLDLANRKNKANGGYCTDFSASKKPFIFANAVGIHDDVSTLIHEGGHCFHAFETFKLPYIQQRWTPMEFNEVASMAMELLASPYLVEEMGGFYSERDAARAMVEQLETNIRFWSYMAIVDAFQHWVYMNPDKGGNPDKCDTKWAELEQRLRPYVDWSGYENVMVTGWHRKGHIHQAPFYYIEYGLAQLGATQVWANALEDQSKAVKNYREGLALGGTVSLPKLYETAGIKFAFDAQTLGKAVKLMEEKIYELELMI